MVNPIIDKMPKAPPEYQGVPRNFAMMTRDKALDMFLGKAMQAGGSVTGSGSGTDSVLSPLTPGEFVVSRPAVGRVGLAVLEAINSGRGVASGFVAEPGWVQDLKDLTNNPRPVVQVSINAAELFEPVEDALASLAPALSRALTEANIGGRVQAAIEERQRERQAGGGAGMVQAEDGSWVPKSFYAKSSDVNVVMNVTNPVPEPASDTAARKMRTLALMGAFA